MAKYNVDSWFESQDMDAWYHIEDISKSIVDGSVFYHILFIWDKKGESRHSTSIIPEQEFLDRIDDYKYDLISNKPIEKLQRIGYNR